MQTYSEIAVFLTFHFILLIYLLHWKQTAFIQSQLSRAKPVHLLIHLIYLLLNQPISSVFFTELSIWALLADCLICLLQAVILEDGFSFLAALWEAPIHLCWLSWELEWACLVLWLEIFFCCVSQRLLYIWCRNILPLCSSGHLIKLVLSRMRCIIGGSNLISGMPVHFMKGVSANTRAR